MYRNKPGFDSLYLFQDVMQCGSFANAAAAAGSTPAAVAKGIARLEAEIGTELFDPESGGTAPTAGGLFLYDKLDNLLWSLEAMLQQARAIPPENNMKLALGISDMIAGSCYRDLLRTFSKCHPAVTLVLKNLSWTDVRRSLVEGNIDAALTYSIAYPKDPIFARRELTRTKPCIYYSEQLISGSPENVELESFRKFPFVCIHSESAVVDMLSALPFEPCRVIFAEDLKSLQLYVVAGLACAMLGHSLQLAELEGVRSFSCSHVDYTVGADIIWDKSNRNPAISLLTSCAGKVFPPVSEEDTRDPA